MNLVSRSLVIQAILISEIVWASGDSQESRALIPSSHSAIVRPITKNIRNLSVESGFTEEELKSLRAVISVDRYKEFHTRALAFWRSPLLRTMAAVGGVDQNLGSEVLRSEDWLTRQRIPLRDPFKSPGKELPHDRFDLVFLSESGFLRISKSKEIVAKSLSESLGSVPISDFCARNPGKKAPFDFAVRFNPWDFATSLVSSSRLDLSLLQLVITPDAFETSEDDKDSDYDNDSNQPGNEHSNEHSNEHNDEDEFRHDEPHTKLSDSEIWRQTLAKLRYADRVNSEKLPINASSIKIFESWSAHFQKFLSELSRSIPGKREECNKIHGVWRELALTKNGSIELFACAAPEGSNEGFSVNIERDDNERVGISYAENIEGITLNSQVFYQKSSLRVWASRQGKNLGVEVQFDQSGLERYRQNASLGAASEMEFSNQKSVIWVESLDFAPNVKDINFYESGAVRSYAHLSEKNAVVGALGFYENGKMRYYVPIKNGKIDGKASWWFPSGQLAGESEFISGKRFGRGRLFYENGVEGFAANYSNHLLHGPLRWSDPTSRPLFRLSFLNHKPNGVLEIKNNGRRVLEARFEFGRTEGVVVLRDINGINVGELPFKNGLLNGTVVLRDGSGRTRLKSSWLDGQAHGVTESFYDNSARGSMCRFSLGHLEEWSSHSKNGVPRYSGTVKNYGDGVAKIQFTLGQESQRLDCTTREWFIEKCQYNGSGIEMMPSLKSLNAKLSPTPSFQFKPEKCGGYSAALDVTRLIGNSVGKVGLDLQTLDSCPSSEFASGMHCVLNARFGAWQIESCVLVEDEVSHAER